MIETIKKWEFVSEDTIIHRDRILTRIRALMDYPNDHVKAGELGGYIEKPENLSDWGWVGGKAKVFDNARICGDGFVYGNGQVYDNARVFGSGLVYNNARLCGDALVRDNGRVHGSARVCDHGRVSGSGRVYGNAIVYGNGHVYGDGCILDRAEISGHTCVSGNGYVKNDDDIIVFNSVGSMRGTLTAHRQKNGSVILVRGCFTGSIEEFLAESAETHRTFPDIKREYELIIEVIKHRFKLS